MPKHRDIELRVSAVYLNSGKMTVLGDGTEGTSQISHFDVVRLHDAPAAAIEPAKTTRRFPLTRAALVMLDTLEECAGARADGKTDSAEMLDGLAEVTMLGIVRKALERQIGEPS